MTRFKLFLSFNLVLSVFIFLANPLLLSVQNNRFEPSSYSIKEVLAAVSENYALPINEALSLIAPEEVGDNIQVTPLLGGGTKSKVFRVDSGNKKYVLRLLDENQPIERRRSELNAHKIGAELQIAPKIFYVDQLLLVVVMELVEGRTLTRDDLNNAEIFKEVMEALKKFHQYPDEGRLVKRTKVGAIQDLYDRYNKKGVVFPSCFDQLHRTLQNDFVVLKREHRPSHGDFNPRNILVTDQGHIYIIDWAQASIDHPFLDIAWLSTFLAANNEQVKGLLKQYLGRDPKESELKETLFFKDVTAFLLATLWIGRQDEKDQGKLDSILEGSLKKGSAYIMEGVSVDDILQKEGMGLTLYSLGWLKEFIDNRCQVIQGDINFINRL
jgi:thiamine kinase-like enzyme